jgi:hypothetical protein
LALSSENVAKTNGAQSIFTRLRPDDAKIAHNLTRVTQLLWENLFPHPPLVHPADPTGASLATKLSILYAWYRSQTRAFIPDSSTFDINNDALQKANIRLAHIAYFGSIILLSRYPLIRAIERGDLPRDASRRDTATGRRKNELDDLQYAEGCIDAAINALNHVHTLVAPISPSSPAFSEHDSDVKDARSSRTVIGVFFCASLTVLLHFSLQPEGAQKAELLDRVLRTIEHLHNFPETLDMAGQFRSILSPFVNAICYPSYFGRRPSVDTGINRRLTTDISNLLKHPTGGIEWLPYHSPSWSWRDLLAAPNALPVGGRMIGDTTVTPTDRTLRGGEGGNSPSRGMDKRVRTNAEDTESQWDRDHRQAAVSKELQALFQLNGGNPPPPP